MVVALFHDFTIDGAIFLPLRLSKARGFSQQRLLAGGPTSRMSVSSNPLEIDF
jgi:hypothetical protein